MKQNFCTSLLFISILHCTRLSTISIVYNFRIAQVTKQPIAETERKRNYTAVALIFDQLQQKYNGIFQNFAGGLGSFIYDFSSYYVRADFAVSQIKETNKHITTFSGVETDDILLTGGRNFTVDNKTRLTLSGLVGIPTHKLYQLQHVDFGYSQVGTGLQFDGSSAFNRIAQLVYGARYIYFFPRNACDLLGVKHKFSIGNMVDILVSSKNQWTHHGFETGYTSRFQFGARACPNLDNIEKKTNYIRSNFYFIYKYKFALRDIPNRFLFNISYGFDHIPKVFGNKYIITLWASWNINF